MMIHVLAKADSIALKLIVDSGVGLKLGGENGAWRSRKH
jgi:hypothetical protein